MKTKRTLIFAVPICVVLGWSACASADVNEIRVTWEPTEIVQGGLCWIRMENPRPVESMEVELSGTKVPLEIHSEGLGAEGLLGVDLQTKAGTHALIFRGRLSNGESVEVSRTVEVVVGEFETEHLTLPSNKVDLDEATLERVGRESKRLKAIWPRSSEQRLWLGAFIRPVEGPIGGLFGSKRILNGEPRSPHTGIDFRSPAGTPVKASNSGVIALVDDLFFSGKTVLIDHGQGLYTMYFHLSEIHVNLEDRVVKGENIGSVGATGRATGPHLHWGVRLGGARVSPLALLSVTSPR